MPHIYRGLEPLSYKSSSQAISQGSRLNYCRISQDSARQIDQSDRAPRYQQYNCLQVLALDQFARDYGRVKPHKLIRILLPSIFYKWIFLRKH